MEGTELHPTQGADNVHRFVFSEVLRVRRERAAIRSEGSKEGERDARVFEMLDVGKGPREIVTTLRQPIDVVLKLVALWKEAGRQDLVVPSAYRTQLQERLGNINDAAELVQLVRGLDDELDRIRGEHGMLDNRLRNLIITIGEVAGKNTGFERILPTLKQELDPAGIESLERAFEYSVRQAAIAATQAASP